MRFTSLPLADAVVIDMERIDDSRGYFARTWCTAEFAAHGIDEPWVQSNVSYNRQAGTLRGLHFQTAPHEEAKLVRCLRGGAYDVLVDLRRDSETYASWTAVELTAENLRQVYIPRGFAHGFQTLTDDTELLYLMSTRYEPTAARGIRWDDPTLAIAWPPAAERIISDRDRSLPAWVP